MEPWEGVVNIPEGKSGDHEISYFTHAAGDPVPRSNFRTALYSGLGPDKHPDPVFDHDTTWHRLSYDGGTWMTDLPIEQQQHDDLLKGTWGRVLVGGLGVGYAANILAAMEDVDEVVVVELSPDVVKLVAEHVIDPDDKITVVTQDLFDYLKEQKDELYTFDFAFYDIWQSDGEGTFFFTVCPLLDLSRDIERVICWNENVMRGQLAMSLQTRKSMKDALAYGMTEVVPEHMHRLFNIEKMTTEQDDPYWDWAVPFWKGVQAGVITDENFNKISGAYAGTYGKTMWQVWWDQVLDGSYDWDWDRDGPSEGV